jgi:NTP pyrophosphatase (non-canonical NTP hydrolase)
MGFIKKYFTLWLDNLAKNIHYITLYVGDYQRDSCFSIKPHDSVEMEKADWALGLSGEVGEVVELVKHEIMHKEPVDRIKLAKEIGDVLWYLSALSTTYNLDLQIIAQLNVEKLQHRHGSSYSKKGSKDRHSMETKFEDTPEYKHLIKLIDLS